ncbi:hypothetical protein V6Z12_D10G227500 [Gossypium hirsutum]
MYEYISRTFICSFGFPFPEEKPDPFRVSSTLKRRRSASRQGSDCDGDSADSTNPAREVRWPWSAPVRGGATRANGGYCCGGGSAQARGGWRGFQQIDFAGLGFENWLLGLLLGLLVLDCLFFCLGLLCGPGHYWACTIYIYMKLV